MGTVKLSLYTGKTILVQRPGRMFAERVTVIAVRKDKKRVMVETRTGERFTVAMTEVQPNPRQAK